MGHVIGLKKDHAKRSSDYVTNTFFLYLVCSTVGKHTFCQENMYVCIFKLKIASPNIYPKQIPCYILTRRSAKKFVECSNIDAIFVLTNMQLLYKKLCLWIELQQVLEEWGLHQWEFEEYKILKSFKKLFIHGVRLWAT